MAKILIIEDNHLNLELASDLLEARGHEVLRATTAEEGVQVARAKRPQLILMDVALPGIDGLTATRLLAQDPLTSTIPVIALTAHAMQGDADDAIAAGCVAYITKPINTREFASTVEKYAV